MIYGEKLALRALELSRKIRRMLRRKYSRDEADFQDAQQDVAVRLLVYGQTDREPISNVDGFVWQAMDNQVLQDIQEQAALPVLPWCRKVDAVADSARTPDDALDWDQRTQLVLQAAFRLPKTLRKVLWLSKRERMTYREIAERMGMTEAQVKASIAKAVYRMKQRLNGVV
jgi:RNA polymerase sigma factor (sigma-70 family)